MAGKQEVKTLTEIAIVEEGRFVEQRFSDGDRIRIPYNCFFNPGYFRGEPIHPCPVRDIHL